MELIVALVHHVPIPVSLLWRKRQSRENREQSECMCKTGTEGEEMFSKKSLVQWNNSGEATLLEGQLPTGEARFAAQATMMALLRFTTQWRQHTEEVRSDLHFVRCFTREPMPGKGLQGFKTEHSSAFPRLSSFTRVSPMAPVL